jgi:hypothetical protein
MGDKYESLSMSKRARLNRVLHLIHNITLALITAIPSIAKADFDGDAAGLATRKIQSLLQGSSCNFTGKAYVTEVSKAAYDIYVTVGGNSMSERCLGLLLKRIDTDKDTSLSIMIPGPSAVIRYIPLGKGHNPMGNGGGGDTFEKRQAEADKRLAAANLPLAWENTTEPHPERKAWSQTLKKQIIKHLPIFRRSKDITFFCPNFSSLDENEEIKAIGDLFVGIARYESSFDPKLYSVDAGTKDDPNTWSVGLFQMSVVDQTNWGLATNFTFQELREPLPNIILATDVMSEMLLARNGIIRVSDKPYWSTLEPGGKNDKSDLIRDNWVLKNNPKCRQ